MAWSQKYCVKRRTLVENTIVPYGAVIYKSNAEQNVVFANHVLKRNIIRND